jgi:hypothetical protein
MPLQVAIDMREYAIKQIGTAMQVSDGINPNAVGQSWLGGRHYALRQNPQHGGNLKARYPRVGLSQYKSAPISTGSNPCRKATAPQPATEKTRVANFHRKTGRRLTEPKFWVC